MCTFDVSLRSMSMQENYIYANDVYREFPYSASVSTPSRDSIYAYIFIQYPRGHVFLRKFAAVEIICMAFNLNIFFDRDSNYETYQ